MTSTPSRSPSVLAAELYLLLLPAGHLLYVQVAGAWATAADLMLLPLLVVTALELLASAERGEALVAAFRGESVGLPSRGYLVGILVLVAFGGWVALSGNWGFHPRYAVVKGLGIGVLALGAGAIAVSGIGWRRAADAWLGGAAVALVLTLVFGILGPEVLRDRVLYEGGGVLGLPFPRISGPLLHPNMMGDYLVVTGVLLWGRWPEFSESGRRWAGGLAAAVAVGLFLTASTAWIAAGVVLVLVGRGARGEADGSRRGMVLGAGGALLAGVTLVAVLVPLDLSFAGLDVATSGIRPRIWQGALSAFFDAPLLGVGAAPFLAEAVDPLDPASGIGLWDAHNAYLSILGQFGVVGALLVGFGVWKVMGEARVAGSQRAAMAVRLALIAVGIHAVFMASEDLRHVWVLMGLVGVGGTSRG